VPLPVATAAPSRRNTRWRRLRPRPFRPPLVKPLRPL